MMREITWLEGGVAPAGKILAVGRNYAAHAAEMKAAAEPVVFSKPGTSLVLPGEPVRLPRNRGEIHYELEIVAHLGSGGTDLTPAAAAGCVDGYGLGLDLTLRTLQAEAKKKGAPWTLTKGFDHSFPVSPFLHAAAVAKPEDLRFELLLDGELRQKGWSGDMLHSVPELLAYLSSWITLEPGDLILTGTPEGVGPVIPGQTARMRLLDHFDCDVSFV